MTAPGQDNSRRRKAKRRATIARRRLAFEALESRRVLAANVLTLTLDSVVLSESNGAATATVTREGDLSESLEVDISFDDASEAAAPTSVTIDAGSASTTFQVTAIDDPLLDGPQHVNLIVSAEAYDGDAQGLRVNDNETLTLEFTPNSIGEDAGGASLMGAVKRPAGDVGSHLFVSLRSSDPAKLSGPSSVMIAAGLDSALFFLQPRDDQLLTGPIDIEITASVGHNITTTETVVVEDRESLTITAAESLLRDDDPLVLTIERGNENIDAPLTVSLRSSDPNAIDLPVSTTIPGGEASVDVLVTARNAAALNAPLPVELIAEADGYPLDSTTVQIVNSKRLHLVASKETIREDAGLDAIEVSITRFDADIGADLIVTLESSDPSELRASQQVVIPAGQRTVVATLDAVDDTLLDGEQQVDVVATSDGHFESSLSVNVTDNESLTLQITSPSVTESDGEAATDAVLRRSNTDVDQPLRVAILNSDTSEAAAPTIVEIPAGATQVTFAIDAIDDQVVDGDQLVVFTASAIGYEEAEDQLQVIDFSRFASWTNPDNNLDVDNSTSVNVRDVLLLVFELRTRGPRDLPPPTPGFRPPPWVDTNADGRFSTLDVFLLIEYINNHPRTARQGEGERATADPIEGLRAFEAQPSFDAAAALSVGGDDALATRRSPNPLRNLYLTTQVEYAVPLAPSSEEAREAAIADAADSEPWEATIDDLLAEDLLGDDSLVEAPNNASGGDS